MATKKSAPRKAATNTKRAAPKTKAYKPAQKPVSKRTGASRFMGADNVYQTKRFIAVRRVKSNAAGRITADNTRYYPKTPKNIREAESATGKLQRKQ